MTRAERLAKQTGLPVADCYEIVYRAKVEFSRSMGFLPSRVTVGYEPSRVCCSRCGHELSLKSRHAQYEHKRQHERADLQTEAVK